MDVPSKSYNKTLYILRRSDNPDFHDCSGLYLRSEYNVREVFLYCIIFEFWMFQELKEWKFWVYGVVSSVLVILGILGNALATFILQKPRMKSAFNQLLIVLCAIDSLFLLTNIPTITQSQGSSKINHIRLLPWSFFNLVFRRSQEHQRLRQRIRPSIRLCLCFYDRGFVLWETFCYLFSACVSYTFTYCTQMETLDGLFGTCDDCLHFCQCAQNHQFRNGNDEECNLRQSQFVSSIHSPFDHHWMVTHFSFDISEYQN